MCSATTLQFGVGGRLGPRHLPFYRERALGGVGLLFTEQLSATPLSETAFPGAIAAYDERAIEDFRLLAEGLAERPTRLFAQLVAGGGMGASAQGLDGWGPVRAPSRIPTPGGDVPLPLSRDEIAVVVSDFARSAANLRAAGVHGIEVHGAHGWLVGEFLSPFYNRREDEYGGDVQGRCRFALEIGRAIREVLGDSFPVGLALSYDECIGQAGITLDETRRQLEVLMAAEVYDFYDLSIGAAHSEYMTISSMTVPENYAFPAATAAKRVVGDRAAVFVAGRVLDIHAAASAVSAGSADMVGMTRAHLADPHIVRKAREAREDEITRCIGENVCVRRALEGHPVACVVNPAAGREALWGDGSLRRADTPLDVLVVGAGPAGLRFAATAAARGHAIRVVERELEPGGHLQEIAWLPTRQSWWRAVDDLVGMLERHGGVLETGREVDVEAALSAAADLVVVATGAEWEAMGASSRRPERERIPVAGAAAAIGLGTALRAARRDPHALGRTVVIVDESASYAPLGLAEVLAAAGATVRVVTSAPAVGAEVAATLELPHVMPRLRALGVTFSVWRDIGDIDGRQVRLDDVWGGEGESLDDVDSVVLALRRASCDRLLDELLDAEVAAHVVGDARAPRTTIEVIHEAEELARGI